MHESRVSVGAPILSPASIELTIASIPPWNWQSSTAGNSASTIKTNLQGRELSIEFDKGSETYSLVYGATKFIGQTAKKVWQLVHGEIEWSAKGVDALFKTVMKSLRDNPNVCERFSWDHYTKPDTFHEDTPPGSYIPHWQTQIGYGLELHLENGWRYVTSHTIAGGLFAFIQFQRTGSTYVRYLEELDPQSLLEHVQVSAPDVDLAKESISPVK